MLSIDQIDHLIAIDQDYPWFDFGYIVPGAIGKVTDCNENPFLGPLSMQRPHKLLDFRPAHSPLPLLCLDINYIKPQFIFLDDAVYPFIAAFPKDFPRIFYGTTISHFNKQLDY